MTGNKGETGCMVQRFRLCSSLAEVPRGEQRSESACAAQGLTKRLLAYCGPSLLRRFGGDTMRKQLPKPGVRGGFGVRRPVSRRRISHVFCRT